MGGFIDDYYWSSTELDSSIAVTIFFSDGKPDDGNKNNMNPVRAIRAF